MTQQLIDFNEKERNETPCHFCQNAIEKNKEFGGDVNDMMDDCFHYSASAIMRELDGDILERGVEESESSDTPVLQPLDNDAKSSPPILSLSSPREMRYFDHDMSNCETDFLASNKNLGTRSRSECHEEEFSEPRLENDLPDRNNNICPTDNLDDTEPLQEGLRYLSSQLESREEVTLRRTIQDVSKVHRSKSYDRKLSEATQYYESLGDTPPTDEDEIIRGVIIEEDSLSDTSDDSSAEVDDGVQTEFENSEEGPITSSGDHAFEVINDLLPQQRMVLSKFQREQDESATIPPPAGEPSCSNSLPLQSSGGKHIPVDHERTGTDFENDYYPFASHQCNFKTLEDTLLNYTSNQKKVIGENHNGYVYKGIRHNPPEIVKQGISRGNYAQLHRKAWLEVSDKYHRYGKNLRLYYKHWETLGHPTNMFFDWLDSKGGAAGQPLPNLKECPRSILDSDTVLYITNQSVQQRYRFDIVPSQTEEGVCIILSQDKKPLFTGPEGWIFVLRDHELYLAPKVTSISGKSKQRFHHSSFFGGKAVASAGILITDNCGKITCLYPHSGHYRPKEAHMQRMLYFLHQSGVDLHNIRIDMQQIMHVSRDKIDLHTPKGGKHVNNELNESNKQHRKIKKTRKTDSLYMKRGSYVALFLAHKALVIGAGIFHQIHKLRRIEYCSVSVILDAIDDGGKWARHKRVNSD